MTKLQKMERHLQRLRAGYRRHRLGLWALGVTAAFLGLFLILLIGDLTCHFPPVLCWVGWIAMLACLGGGLYLAAVACRRKLTDAAMAVVIEKALPSSQNQLINTVQLKADGRVSADFIDQLLAEHELPVDQLRASHLCSQRPLKLLTGALLGTMAVFLIAFLITPRGVVQSTMRLAMPMARIQPYTLTRIVAVNPGNATLLRGRDLPITVDISGQDPGQAEIVCERATGKPLVLPLKKLGAAEQPDRGSVKRLQTTVAGVFTNSRYRVIAGDARSPWFNVTVTNPPGVLSWEARVTPPPYLKREPYVLDKTSASLEVPAGSAIELTGEASCRLKQVRASQDGETLAEEDGHQQERFSLAFNIGNGGRLKLMLEAESGLTAEETLPFVMLLDQSPIVVLVDTERTIMARPDMQVPITFQVDDDFGVLRVGIERLLPQGVTETVNVVPLDRQPLHFASRFIVDLPSFAAREGDEFRFQVWAEDNAPPPMRHRGKSTVVTLHIPRQEDAQEAGSNQADRIKNSLLDLVRMQRANLRTTRNLQDTAQDAGTINYAQLRNAQATQNQIRELTIQLVQEPEALGDLRVTLTALVNHEMADVIAVMDRAHRLMGEELQAGLAEAVRLETTILGVLTGMPTQLQAEEKHQRRVDLLGRLQRLVAKQDENLEGTKQAAERGAKPGEMTPLVQVQDRLALDFTAFTDQCWVVMEETAEDDLNARVRDVYDLFAAEAVYEKMLLASEALAFADMPAAIQQEKEIRTVLMRGLDILNKWRIKNAKDRLEKALETIEKVDDALTEMERRQSQICEVTRDLTKRGTLDDDIREQLGKMDAEQKDMGKLIETLAQDLYQFPELPVCNELNSKMHEIFEDVEQAADSENAPSVEIAVQKEDSFLEAIRNTKERVEDIEMWLPEVPDNIVWNMESFDTDEFPDIPLVPLPDELEDLVGDLLDQASEIDDQSQDTTGNNMMADGEMGWDVMDGPIPNFSAKGKSGNTRPNDNEMTGRSGAGREGQSNGELVEDHVKGLEGRETHARRTRDPLQKGQVTEDENSTMDARATGGGKLGGESETTGMFGNAPRRDQNVADHGGSARALRQETEALYATARLLYLGTGTLGTASREMQNLETKVQEMKSFDSLHRKVLRQLKESQTEIADGVVLPMPVQSVSKTGGAAVQDVDISAINDTYRDIVSDYYKGLEKD